MLVSLHLSIFNNISLIYYFSGSKIIYKLSQLNTIFSVSTMFLATNFAKMCVIIYEKRAFQKHTHPKRHKSLTKDSENDKTEYHLQ